MVLACSIWRISSPSVEEELGRVGCTRVVAEPCEEFEAKRAKSWLNTVKSVALKSDDDSCCVTLGGGVYVRLFRYEEGEHWLLQHLGG